MAGSTLLHPGDVIAFGHINGAAIQPGAPAPQTNPEFAYIVSSILSSFFGLVSLIGADFVSIRSMKVEFAEMFCCDEVVILASRGNA